MAADRWDNGTLSRLREQVLKELDFTKEPSDVEVRHFV